MVASMPMPGGMPAPTSPEDGGAPMGASPATAPTENAGAEAKGMQATAVILDAATKLMSEVGVATPIGQLLLDFVKKGSKLVQPGAVSPAGKQNQLDEMQRNNQQNGQQMAMIRQSAGQQQQQPPAAGAGA